MGFSNALTDDECLRRHGFHVVSRPSDGPVRWERGGVVLTQDQALAVVSGEEKAQLEAAAPGEAGGTAPAGVRFGADGKPADGGPCRGKGGRKRRGK